LEFHKRFLENKLRTDGRLLNSIRKTIITTGSLRNTTEGSSLVKMGNTSVICGIKAEVTVPKGKQYSSENEMRMGTNEEQGEGADEGFYIITVELPSICSPRFQHWSDSQKDVSTIQFHIQNTLEQYKVIDKKELCIEKGTVVWVLYIDIFVLEHDGNLLDACFIAALAALDNLELPAVELVNDVVKVVENRTTTRLNLTHFPIPLSFVTLTNYTLIDPTSEEEDLSSTHFTFIFNEKGKLCSFYKPGGDPLSSQSQLKECIPFAKQRAIDVYNLIKAANSTGNAV